MIEKDTLNAQIATLAEALGVPSGVLYNAARRCPQNHFNYRNQLMGEICQACIETFFEEQEPYGETFPSVDSVRDYMASFPEMIQARWEIGRIPRDFTQAKFLDLVMENLLCYGEIGSIEFDTRRFRMDEDWGSECIITTKTKDFRGAWCEEEGRGEAEARAFFTALSAYAEGRTHE